MSEIKTFPPSAVRSTYDACRFLAQWGRSAEALGWDVRDLFGLLPASDKMVAGCRRLSRLELVGLIWLLRGRPVVALTATGATIRATSGSILTYSRRAGAVTESAISHEKGQGAYRSRRRSHSNGSAKITKRFRLFGKS
jgi:hypothetical protein